MADIKKIIWGAVSLWVAVFGPWLIGRLVIRYTHPLIDTHTLPLDLAVMTWWFGFVAIILLSIALRGMWLIGDAFIDGD